MTVTTESGGRQNAFPNETRPYIDESVSYDGYPQNCLLYTSPSPRDATLSRMPSSA